MFIDISTTKYQSNIRYKLPHEVHPISTTHGLNTREFGATQTHS